jgi:uncharacterized protein YggT (Ycf19 family)
MALVLVVLQTLIMVAALALLGQFIVGIFNWNRRQENFVYQLFQVLTRPVVAVMRRLTPRVVLDQHVPLVAFLILFFCYFAIGFWHRDVCLQDLTQLGCAKWAEARAGAAR